MSTIEQKLAQIIEGVEGEDVRGAIHDAIEEAYVGANNAKDAALSAAASANGAVTRANNSIALMDSAMRTTLSGAEYAETVSDMRDIYQIYVYTGNESGYTAGHWYKYVNGSWTDGGEYKDVLTDKTFSAEGVPADAAYIGYSLSGEKTITSFLQGRPTESSRQDRCYTGLHYCHAGDIIFVTGNTSGQKFVIAGPSYDSGWKTTNFSYEVQNPGDYYVVIAKTNGTDQISPDEITGLTVTFNDGSSQISKINRINSDVGLLNTMLGNVDYGSKDSIASEPGISIERHGLEFLVDGTYSPTTVTGGIVKLNGLLDLKHATQRSAINSWEGIQLKAGHTYDANIDLLSGDYNGTFGISVYRQGESTTIGSAIVVAHDRNVRRFYAEEGHAYNLVFYIVHGTEFETAKFTVYLKDVTQDTPKFPDDDAYVDYDYDIPFHKVVPREEGNYTTLSISREGMFVTLNAELLTGVTIVRLNDFVTITHDIPAFVPFQAIPGHTYKFTVKHVDGLQSNTDSSRRMPVVSVYEENSSSSVGEAKFVDDKTFERVFTANETAQYMICFYIHAYWSFTDATYKITLEDLTASAVEDPWSVQYLPEVSDTVAKVRDVNNEPALVFLWVTDIHRYKASVQTFDDMIKNMSSVVKELKCDFVLDTGDTIEGDKTKDVSLSQAYLCLNELESLGMPILYVNGNHDNNPYSASGAYTFDLNEVYKGFFTHTKNVRYNQSENGTDYYLDFDGLGIRFVVLNSCNPSIANNYGFGNSTANWLADALDTDRLVILASHVSPIPAHVWNNISPSGGGTVKSSLDAFVGNGGQLIVLTGHSHIDAEFISPYVEITNVCQKFDQANTTSAQYQMITGAVDGIRNPERSSADYTADAWSVVVCKPTSQELAVIRFGAGTDRYIHYQPTSETALSTRLSGTVTWSSTDTMVATVSSSGSITKISDGNCGIFAKDDAGNMELWLLSTY